MLPRAKSLKRSSNEPSHDALLIHVEQVKVEHALWEYEIRLRGKISNNNKLFVFLYRSLCTCTTPDLYFIVYIEVCLTIND